MFLTGILNSFANFTAIPGSGATARQTLANNTPYTFTYMVERLTATNTRISVSVTGGALSNLNWTAIESSTPPHTTFDWFAFRIGGSNFASQITFTQFTVNYVPAAPVITAQPQPSNFRHHRREHVALYDARRRAGSRNNKAHSGFQRCRRLLHCAGRS